MTVALARKLKELLLDLVVLERTPRHDSPANCAERAIRTLEEQVKVMRLDVEKRTELFANSCLGPWLIRHAGRVDSRFRIKTRTTGRTPLSFSRREVVPFRVQLPHSHRTHKPKQNDLEG